MSDVLKGIRNTVVTIDYPSHTHLVGYTRGFPSPIGNTFRGLWATTPIYLHIQQKGLHLEDTRAISGILSNTMHYVSCVSKYISSFSRKYNKNLNVFILTYAKVANGKVTYEAAAVSIWLLSYRQWPSLNDTTILWV